MHPGMSQLPTIAPLPASGSVPEFSVIIVSLNGARRLPACLNALEASLGRFARPATEVIVVDNGSHDDTSRVVRDGYPWVKLLRAPKNLGFAGGNNLGLAHATGRIPVLLNDDTYPQQGWLEALHRAAAAHPQWGALGCLLLYPADHRVQHAGGVIEGNALTKHMGWGDAENDWVSREPFEADYVSGAAMALRREALEELGALDAAYFPIYFEETDLCVRFRAAGYGIHMVPASVVLHDESQVTGLRSRGFYIKYQTNRLRFILKTRTRAQLVETLRAEMGWLWWHHPWDQLVPLTVAWAKNLMRAPATWVARRRHFALIRRARKSRSHTGT